jgi:hypothetical protein
MREIQSDTARLLALGDGAIKIPFMGGLEEPSASDQRLASNCAPTQAESLRRAMGITFVQRVFDNLFMWPSCGTNTGRVSLSTRGKGA